jgi:short subunit fatty acids transporter
MVSDSLGLRIVGAIFILIGLLFAAAARRVPDYCAKRGTEGLVGYGQFVFYAGAAGFGLMGAWLILADL